ncbi:hypothetical protein SB748_27855 [Rhizobium sp. SIMBA_035]
MSHSRRSFLKIATGAGLAAVFLPFGGMRFLSLDAFSKNGNNGNGGGNNGNGGGNGGGNGNAGGGTGNGNGNGNNGNGKGNGGPTSAAEPSDTGPASMGAGVQATRSADGTIRIRHGNGITETIVSNRYVMKDAKGRTISNRLADPADVARLSRYLH